MLLFFMPKIDHKMKKILLIVIVIISFGGCKDTENIVHFGKSSKLALDSNEINHNPISKADLKHYEKNCYVESDGILLNRVLSNTNKNYTIFIEACEILHKSELPPVIKSDTSFSLIEEKKVNGKKLGYDNYFLKKNHNYISKTVYNEPVTGLLIIYNYCTQDSSQAYNYFNNLNNSFDSKINP